MFIYVFLFLFSLNSEAQVTPGYHVRAQANRSSQSYGLTNQNCYLTGRHQGHQREVICPTSQGTIKGWVNRMGIERQYRSAGTQTFPRNSRFNSAHSSSGNTSFFSNVTDRVQQLPIVQGIGRILRSFKDTILSITPKRIRERRRVSAKSGRRENVDIVEMPEVKVPGDKHGSPLCGSYRARSRSKLYFTAQAGCLMTAVAQKWRQEHCPNNHKDCRLVVGDASHGEKLPSSWPHSTHRDGRCIDIYLPRKNGKGLTDQAGNKNTYSREKTRALIQILVDHGGAPNAKARAGSGVLFSGQGGPHAIRHRNHGNHIHVCFPETRANQRKCDKTEFNSQLCPELGQDVTAGSPSPSPSPSTATDTHR